MDLPDQFSEKEKSVIELLLQGKSNKQMALILQVTPRTIEYHLTNIYNKLGVNSRSEAILFITNNISVFRNQPASSNFRESTVAAPPEVGNTVTEETPAWRQRMRTNKYIFAVIGLVAFIFLAYLILSNRNIPNLISTKNQIEPYPSIVSSPSPMVNQLADLSDEQLGLHSLVDFLSYLNQGDYEKAAQLYGGSYDTMLEQNPGLDPADHRALLENACTVNGAQCLQINSAGPASAGPYGTDSTGRVDEFEYQVEFIDITGSLFVLGPCCGGSATDFPPQSAFYFTVIKTSAGRFLVLDMPPYLP